MKFGKKLWRLNDYARPIGEIDYPINEVWSEVWQTVRSMLPYDAPVVYFLSWPLVWNPDAILR